MRTPWKNRRSNIRRVRRSRSFPGGGAPGNSALLRLVLAALTVVAFAACSSPNRTFDTGVDPAVDSGFDVPNADVARVDAPRDSAAADHSDDQSAADSTDDPESVDDTGFPSCPDGELDCDGSCTVVLRDPANCGACGQACGTGQVCIDGACGCPTGRTMCHGQCVSITSDVSNCGACGRACPAHQFCTAGTCSCALGEEFCGGACVDTVSNPLNCGFCGVTCLPGQTCFRGMCGCPVPTLLCGGSRCIDTRVDPANCGDCGQACGANQTCVTGACQCPNGGTACGASCVDASTDGQNCGSCGNACPTNQYCVSGHCTLTCTAPQQRCSVGAYADCVDTSVNARNCGGCGLPCALGEVCTAGHCDCPPGTRSCGGRCIDVSRDPANCGACGATCSAATACVSGACACRGGLLSCGGACIDATRDAANCGACGNVCPALSYCSGNTCQCAPGFAMCNGRCVDLAADAANCGVCGQACTGDTFCIGGTCACLARGGTPGTYSYGFTSGSHARTYSVHFPPTYDPARPSALFIGFHGITDTGETFMTDTGYNDVADERNFVVMYPDGVDRSWNAGACCGPAQLLGVDDVRFARELVAHARLDFCVDPNRVYATGFSNGSIMAQRLGCEASDVFVGIGVHAGPLAISSCTPSQPVSVVYSHSINDPIVDFNGSSILGTTSAPATFATWGVADACMGVPASVYSMGIAHCSEYQNCAQTTQVQFCQLDRDTHDWPRVSDFDTTEYFAQFLLAHPRH